MTWFKVDDKLHAHPKVSAAGLRGMGLWVVAGSWCAAYERDGAVSAEFVRLHGAASVARQLVDAELWVPDGNGFLFHDWAAFQPTRAQLDEQRKVDAERQARWRSSRNGVSHA